MTFLTTLVLNVSNIHNKTYCLTASLRTTHVDMLTLLEGIISNFQGTTHSHTFLC